MKIIYLRADGSSKIGLGHVMRLLAVSDMLKDKYSIIFVIRETEREIIQNIKNKIQHVLVLNQTEDDSAFLNILDKDCLVFLDGYTFQSGYQKSIKETGASLICIDDLFDRHFYADAVINHAGKGNGSFYSKEPYTQLYLGADYALLRLPFVEAAQQKRQITNMETAFVNMGGSDEYNITEKILNFLLEVNWIKNINIVVGASYKYVEILRQIRTNGKTITIYQNIDAKEMCAVLKDSQLAICPASTISYEVCAVGLYCITGWTADNQKYILAELVDASIAESIDSFFNLDAIKFKKIAEETHRNFLKSPVLALQKKYIDGKSPQRIIKIIEDIGNRKTTF